MRNCYLRLVTWTFKGSYKEVIRSRRSRAAEQRSLEAVWGVLLGVVVAR